MPEHFAHGETPTTSHRTHLFQTLPFWCIKAFELENLTYSGTKCATMCNPKPGMSKNGNCSNKNAWEVFLTGGLSPCPSPVFLQKVCVPSQATGDTPTNERTPHLLRGDSKKHTLFHFFTRSRLLKSGARRQALQLGQSEARMRHILSCKYMRWNHGNSFASSEPCHPSPFNKAPPF